jgi:hypothetical protein
MGVRVKHPWREDLLPVIILGPDPRISQSTYSVKIELLAAARDARLKAEHDEFCDFGRAPIKAEQDGFGDVGRAPNLRALSDLFDSSPMGFFLGIGAACDSAPKTAPGSDPCPPPIR